MPTYEYECKKCGIRFERFQSIKAEPLTTCDECGGPVERLISAGGGLIFKGSGFYVTDYRSDSYKSGAKRDSGNGSSTKSEAGSSSSTSTSSD